MKKITALTEYQTRRLVEVREEWRAIGLTTGPINRTEVSRVFQEMYQHLNQPVVPLVILPSPASALLSMPMIAYFLENGVLAKPPGIKLMGQLKDQLGDQLGSQLKDQLWGRLGSQLKDQLKDQLWDQLGGQLKDQLGDQLGSQLKEQLKDQLWGQLWGQLKDQLGDQLWDQLGGQLGSQLKDQLGDQLGGQLKDQLGGQLGYQIKHRVWTGFLGHGEIYWIAFYRFCEEIGCVFSPEQRRQLSWWETLGRHCGWWWAFKKVVIAADRPTITQWNASYQLHADQGPAIEFSDGYQLWALNGVRVPKKLIMTAAHNLNSRYWVLQQSNAEIRREAVRKIGIERVCSQLGVQTREKQDAYELLTLELGDQRRRPYLKMVNPSTGTYHLEGVPPNITTIQEALTWRNQSDQHPLLLT